VAAATHAKPKRWRSPKQDACSILALGARALACAILALGLPAAAAADSAETATLVTVQPGPLALYGVPATRSFTPLVLCTTDGLTASLPETRVVDATGSGRGWHLELSVPTGDEAWVQATVSEYNGPDGLRPRSAGDIQLARHPRTIAYALRGQGMGTTVLRISVHAQAGVRLRFWLRAR
jgi:hypothetical protein